MYRGEAERLRLRTNINISKNDYELLIYLNVRIVSEYTVYLKVGLP